MVDYVSRWTNIEKHNGGTIIRLLFCSEEATSVLVSCSWWCLNVILIRATFCYRPTLKLASHWYIGLILIVKARLPSALTMSEVRGGGRGSWELLTVDARGKARLPPKQLGAPFGPP